MSGPIESITNAAGFEITPIQDHNPRTRIKYPHAKLWRGDHGQCSHASGECEAFTGWTLHGDGSVVPSVAHIPVSDSARTTVTTFATGKDPLTGKPTEIATTVEGWRAKGNVSLDEAKGVRPSKAVFDRLLMKHLRAFENDLKQNNEKFSDRASLLSERRSFYESRFTACPTQDAPTKLRKPGRA